MPSSNSSDVPASVARSGRLIRHRGDGMLGSIAGWSAHGPFLTRITVRWADGILNTWYGERIDRLEFLGPADVPDTHYGDLHGARF